MNFFEKFEARSTALDTILCLGLDPCETEVEKFKSTTKYEEYAKKFLTNQELTEKSQSFCHFKVYCLYVLDSTLEFIACVKPNLAFFLARGLEGLEVLLDVSKFLSSKNVPVLLDCKVGDIGSTTEHYKKFVFDVVKADACTLNTYMGTDVLKAMATDSNGNYVHPVLPIVKTSNSSSNELQSLKLHDSSHVYLQLLKNCQEHIKDKNYKCGYVFGANSTEAISAVRKLYPDVYLLTPGVGAQGADLAELMKCALSPNGKSLIIPISRSITNSNDPHTSAKYWRDEINKYKKIYLN